jgi:hypothetical protein
MRIRSKTDPRSAGVSPAMNMLHSRSAGVPPAVSSFREKSATGNAGETPAFRSMRRAAPWCAAIVAILAWSSVALADDAPAKAKSDPAKPNSYSGTTTVSPGTVSGTVGEGKLVIEPTITLSGTSSNSGLTTTGIGTLVLYSGTTTINLGAQQFPKTLDRALTVAMEQNPDIATATAKVKLAEAELNATQMEVTRKIIAKWTERQSQAHVFALLQTANTKAPGSVAMSDLIAAGASLDRIEADLRYLIGLSSPAALRGDTVSVTATCKKATTQLPHGPAVEKVRKALLATTTLSFTDYQLTDVVDYLKDLHKIEIQIDIVALAEGHGDQSKIPITIDVKGVSLAAAIQAIEDKYPGLKFVVRNYGILVTTPVCAERQGYFPVSDLDKGCSSYYFERSSPTEMLETKYMITRDNECYDEQHNADKTPAKPATPKKDSTAPATKSK